MKKLALIATTLLLATPSFALDAPKTDDQKTLYSIGAAISKSLSVFNLTQDELEYVKMGLMEAQSGKQPGFDLASYTPKVQELARSRRKQLGDKQAAAGKEFLDAAAQVKGAVKTGSGMVYRSINEGKGDSPKSSEIVKVNYRGTLPDGKEFDSSYKRGKPLEFKLDNVIKCWTEGLQLMKPGGKAQLVCPANLAYGDNGAGDLILPGATLSFEVELLEVKAADVPVVVPKPAPAGDKK